MGIGTTILSILYILLCCFLILIILLQRGDSGGLGGLGGGMGGGGDSFLGATADRTIKKMTMYVSIVFIFFSIFLGVIESPSGSRARDEAAPTDVLPEGSIPAGELPTPTPDQ